MYNQQHHSIVVLKSTFYEFRRMTSFSSNSDYPTFASSYTLFHSISLCRYNTIIQVSPNSITESTVIWVVVCSSSPRWQPSSIFLVEQKKMRRWLRRRVVGTVRKRGDIDGHITPTGLVRLRFRLLSVFIKDFY